MVVMKRPVALDTLTGHFEMCRSFTMKLAKLIESIAYKHWFLP